MKKKNAPNKFDNYLPKINVDANLSDKSINHLPKIVFEGKNRFSESNKLKIIRLLSLINPNDLVGLSSIRIVSEIKSIYGGTTVGCYYKRHKNKDAEILLNEQLFGRIRNVLSFFEHLIYNDRLLEVLYHEIGHHKATKIHSMNKYKGEAFAEKYMDAYKKAYFKKHPPLKIIASIFKLLRRPIFLIIKGISYSLRTKFPLAKLTYRYFNKELTREEYSTELQLISNNKEKSKKKNKLHPLQKAKYRKKFRINKIY